jgi:ParB/RepB/Spo0J family partition protein
MTTCESDRCREHAVGQFRLEDLVDDDPASAKVLYLCSNHLHSFRRLQYRTTPIQASTGSSSLAYAAESVQTYQQYKEDEAMKLEHGRVDDFTLEQKDAAGFRNPREFVDAKEIRELADSIVQSGLQYPLQVWRSGEELVVVDGGRRLRALQLLQKEKRGKDRLDKIPYVVIAASAVNEARELALIANVQRVELSSFEIAKQLQALKDAGIPQVDIATRIAKSATWVSRALSAYAKASPSVRKAWRAGRLPDDDVQTLAKLPEPEQEKRLTEIMTHRDRAERGVPGETREAKAAARAAVQRSKPNGKGKRNGAAEPAPKHRVDGTLLRRFHDITSKAPKSNRYVQGLHDAFRFILGEIGPAEFHKEFNEWAEKFAAKTDKAKTDKAA